MSDLEIQEHHKKNDRNEGWKLQAKNDCASCLIECTISSRCWFLGVSSSIMNRCCGKCVCFIYICTHSHTQWKQIVSEAAVYWQRFHTVRAVFYHWPPLNTQNRWRLANTRQEASGHQWECECLSTSMTVSFSLSPSLYTVYRGLMSDMDRVFMRESNNHSLNRFV